MFLLLPAHPDCPGQFPQSRKTVVCIIINHLSMSLCVCELATFSLESGGNDRWIKFNANMTGLYRVHYAVDNWQALIAQLKEDHTVSNLNILESVFLFVAFVDCQLTVLERYQWSM